MKHHEREYFISRIRSGTYRLNINNTILYVKPNSMHEEYELNAVYMDVYNQCKEDGVLTSEEMLEELQARGLWTSEDKAKEAELEKDIEKLKVGLFESRNDTLKKKHIKIYLKHGKEQLSEHVNKKHLNSQNTCEGIANIERFTERIRISTFTKDEELFDFESISIQEVAFALGQVVLSEEDLRDLARWTHWRNLWAVRDNIKLFDNQDECLNTDQSNLMIWSKMYDNVFESMDCPSDDVIEDDDMLDGWFIIQKRKQDQEKSQKELENSSTNSKIANADEVLIMAKTREDAERINSSNSIHAQRVKKQRMQVLQERGEAVDLDFQDQKLKLQNMAHEQFKDKFRR